MLVAIETDDRRAGHGESSTRSLGCQEQLACPVLFDRLGIRVVALLVVRRAPVLGRDGQAPPRLGRDASDESDRDHGDEAAEGEARPGAARSCARRSGGGGSAFSTARV